MRRTLKRQPRIFNHIQQMTSDQSDPTKPHGLIVSPSIGLVKLSDGGSSALTEIIGRSLLHIKTSRDLVMPARKAGEESEFEIAPGVKIVMCWIPPGEFLMGSPKKEVGRLHYEVQHLVKITRGFWLSKTQTTQAHWQVVMNSNPSHVEGENRPVEQVSWNDICGNESGTGGFIGELNKLAPKGGRFHLPTEAQWEYACRGGTTGPYAGRHLKEMAWYSHNSENQTHPVGEKKSNEWGLHDMHGNVWEWCSDYAGAYDALASIDPVGPVSGSDRGVRGGSWFDVAGDCRAAVRCSCDPDSYDDGIGFRLAHSSILSKAIGGANGAKPGTSGVAE